MRQIRDMSIMEIDITNACTHRCSNCTRFCGHHKSPFFMDYETFVRAVDSLEGYPGLISTIGGEPLLHPEYNRFAAYLKEKNSGFNHLEHSRAKALVKDYLGFAKTQRWFEGAMNKGRGHLLFTSMPGNYVTRYEAVEDTVTDLWLNDHTNPSFHQPILVSRRDLGISDEDFKKMRENCWLQNFWSASITPKGCFFCEIAGTLDLLFDGPGGKPIERGWWDKDLSYFEDQFHWCDICGMALETYSRNANDEMDDASETLIKLLQGVDSPRLKQGRVAPLALDGKNREDEHIGADMGSVGANYLPDNDKRVGNAAAALKPSAICAVVTEEMQMRLGEPYVEKLLTLVDKVIVLTTSDAQYIEPLEKKYEGRVICKKTVGQILGIGAQICAAKSCVGAQEWLLLADEPIAIWEGFSKEIKQYFVNPGYLFKLSGNEWQGILVSPHAKTIRALGFDGMRACKTVLQVVSAFGQKTCSLYPGFEKEPDVEIGQLSEIVRKEYAADAELVKRIQSILQGKEGKNVLLLQSAFVYHTLGIERILKDLGYTTFVISSEKFVPYFTPYVEKERIVSFSDSHFSFGKQKEIREEMKGKGPFVGAIVPFSFGPSTIKPIDDYTDALQTAEDVAGEILGVINIRRELIQAEYDYWDVDSRA